MNLLERCRRRQAQVVETIRRLVELETPSTDPEATARGLKELAYLLRQLGLRVRVEDAPGYGGHLHGSLEGGGGRPLLLLGHLDTVWPVGTLARRPFTVEGGFATGPGIYDMKGGLALVLHALELLRELGEEPRSGVELVVNTDEELGSPTSRGLIERVAAGCSSVLVFEPGDLPTGAVNTSRKGVINLELVVHGRAAHAGADHARGINAAVELAHHTLWLAGLTDYEVGSTVNVGVVRAGERSNVVPDRAEADVDIRVATMAEASRMEALVRGMQPTRPGIGLDISWKVNRPPFECHPGVAGLYAHARGLARDLGFDLPDRPGSGGASDGNFTAAMGLPTLCGLGVVGDGAHAEHERIALEFLPSRLALCVRLLQTL